MCLVNHINTVSSFNKLQWSFTEQQEHVLIGWRFGKKKLTSSLQFVYKQLNPKKRLLITS